MSKEILCPHPRHLNSTVRYFTPGFLQDTIIPSTFISSPTLLLWSCSALNDDATYTSFFRFICISTSLFATSSPTLEAALFNWTWEGLFLVILEVCVPTADPNQQCDTYQCWHHNIQCWCFSGFDLYTRSGLSPQLWMFLGSCRTHFPHCMGGL